jgi:hypothetical protein
MKYIQQKMMNPSFKRKFYIILGIIVTMIIIISLVHLYTRESHPTAHIKSAFEKTKPTKQSIGHVTWRYMHSMLANLKATANGELSEETKTKTIQLIQLVQQNLFCQQCSDDFAGLLKKYPADKLKTKFQFENWLCKLHNKVNKKLSKPKFDCSKLKENYQIEGSA